MADTAVLIHMKGRIYDARLGRFVQADPFVKDGSDTQSFNRYAYVRNAPLHRIDPTGFIETIYGIGRKLPETSLGVGASYNSGYSGYNNPYWSMNNAITGPWFALGRAIANQNRKNQQRADMVETVLNNISAAAVDDGCCDVVGEFDPVTVTANADMTSTGVTGNKFESGRKELPNTTCSYENCGLLGMAINGRLTSDFEKRLFANYWLKNGDVQLT